LTRPQADDLHLTEPRSINKSGRIDSASDWISPNLYPTNEPDGKLLKPKISDMTFGQLRDEQRDLERQLALPRPPTNLLNLRTQLWKPKDSGDLTDRFASS